MQSTAEQSVAIQSESERLVKFLESLPTDGWYRQTDLEQWQVRDVVVHLTERAIGFYSETMALGVKGEVIQPPGFYLPVPTDEDSRRGNIAERAIAQRVDDVDAMIRGLTERSGRFVALLDRLEPTDMDKPCWVVSGTRAVKEIGPIIVQEVAIHSWDIRSIFEPWPSLCEESLSPLRQRIVEVLSNSPTANHSAGFSISSGAENPVRYRVVLTDHAQESHDLVLHQGRAGMENPSQTQADVTLECDGETFALLFYKRVTAERAIAEGRLVAHGPDQLIADFNSWLNDVKVPGLH